VRRSLPAGPFPATARFPRLCRGPTIHERPLAFTTRAAQGGDARAGSSREWVNEFTEDFGRGLLRRWEKRSFPFGGSFEWFLRSTATNPRDSRAFRVPSSGRKERKKLVFLARLVPSTVNQEETTGHRPTTY
jgi:hypothetical protein